MYKAVQKAPNLVQLQMVLYWFSFIALIGTLLVRKHLKKEEHSDSVKQYFISYKHLHSV